jgi:predicted PurR-regulated permease PerM
VTATSGWRSPTAPLWILGAVAVAFFLRESRNLCLPVALAALLSFALAPIVRLLQRLHLSRMIATTTVLGLLLGAALWGGAAAGQNIAAAVDQLPETIRQLEQRLQRGGGTVIEQFQRVQQELRGFGRSSTQPGGTALAPATTTALWSGSASVIDIAGNLVVIVFLVFFFLATASAYRPRLLKLLAPHLSGRGEATELLDEITGQIERFIVVRIITAVAVGVATWIALLLMGAPQPGLWGALAGIVNSIPFFGPVLVGAGVFVVGLLAQGVSFGAELALVTLVITSLEGWLLTPALMGKAARMHPLAIFIGLLLWSWLWGIWGTILAVPMMAVAKVIADHVATLAPLSTLVDE